MDRIPFIDLQAQYRAYQAEIDAALQRVVQSGVFVQGPEVEALERELEEYVGVAHCVSCGSGTDALYIALRAVGAGPGDEVITTGFSFFATSAAISLVGAQPVFADIDLDTCNLSPAAVEHVVTSRTKAVIAVGLYGQPADMDALAAVAERHGLVVIEDAAQSFGATHNGRKSGTLGRVGCTSFYPAKPLGAFGEGGALFTADDDIALRMRQVMNQGQRAAYDHARIGINGRLDAIQAAVLRVKLSHFDDELRARERVAARYDEGLAGVAGVTLPVIRRGTTSVFAQYTIRTRRREALRSHLTAHGVPSAVHYPVPMYRQDAYAHFGERWISDTMKKCPNCELVSQEVLSLPFGPFLGEIDQRRVVETIACQKGEDA